VLFSLALIAAFAGYGALSQLLTPTWVRENVIPPIENALGRTVSFDGLSIGLGEVILTGVRLSEHPDFISESEQNFALIERLELGLDVSALTDLRLVVNRLELIRPYVRLYRSADAHWNIRALVEDAKARSTRAKARKATRAPAKPPPDPAPFGVDALLAPVRASFRDWTGWLIHDVTIRGGLLLVEDHAARHEQYRRVAVRDIMIDAHDLRLNSPIQFGVRALVMPDEERVWAMDVDAMFDIAENNLNINGGFDVFDLALIISQLARPIHLPPRPKKQAPQKPFQLEADLEIERLKFWHFDVTDVVGSIGFHGRTLELRSIKARQGDGSLSVNGNIRFEPTYAQHDLSVKLDQSRFAEGLGRLFPPPWNTIEGTQTLEVHGKFKAPRGMPFSDSLFGIGVEPDENAYLRATVVLDSPLLDLDALTSAAAGDSGEQARDYGPVNTGHLDAEIAITLDELRFRDIDFVNARAKASLRDSIVEIAAFETDIKGGGTTSLSGNIVLDRKGFAYAARADIDAADHGVLLRSIAHENWGLRSGRTDVRLTLSGAGTKWETIEPNLKVELGIVVHDGYIRDAEFLKLLADQTGIDGFRSMELVESGGVIKVSDGRISSTRLMLGSDEARVLARGSLGFDETLDLKIKLGFGPDTERRLLSRGVLLPYQHDEDGWTNIPLIIKGTFADPHITIESSALASTAVNMLPDATKRLGKESANVTRAITDTAADAMPKPAGDLLRGAHSATEAVIGGTYGSLEALVRGLARVMTGGASSNVDAGNELPSKSIQMIGNEVAPALPSADLATGNDSEPDEPIEPGPPNEPEKPVEPKEPYTPDETIEPEKPVDPAAPNEPNASN
jgi:hypothetical protein